MEKYLKDEPRRGGSSWASMDDFIFLKNRLHSSDPDSDSEDRLSLDDLAFRTDVDRVSLSSSSSSLTDEPKQDPFALKLVARQGQSVQVGI